LRIPFEQQQDNFRCGAAALAMVYRALGRGISQDEIWSRVGRQEGTGRWASPTYKLCQDALRQGLTGLVLQARSPGWRLLEVCQRHDLFAIVQHRFNAQQGRGHFSVLVSCSADRVILHDPQQGPDQAYAPDAFQQLWARQHTGHILVVLADGNRPVPTCTICGQPPVAEKTCPRCQQVIRLEPAAALGCADLACPAALWARVFCPHCDGVMQRLS
jgi:ABC-type bacteriocin/lantibiotic exporter with double-glycine peptidase domain